MNAVIFAGPSLPPSLRPKTAATFDWRPPVRQGELYRAALSRPAVIGVVDGYFEATPTVWHKEILWAMAQGIHVFGAGSIGALIDDDEVAVLHGPAELGYPALTEAMVNIRASLAAAVRSGIIAPSLVERQTVTAKALFYKERTWQAVLGAMAVSAADAAALTRFEAWLPSGRVDQKRLDALAMLEAIGAHLAANPPPLVVDYELADTAAWHTAKRDAHR